MVMALYHNGISNGNGIIPLAFHIKCANNFNNSKTQHQAKNINGNFTGKIVVNGRY